MKLEIILWLNLEKNSNRAFGNFSKRESKTPGGVISRVGWWLPKVPSFPLLVLGSFKIG
jgi:hypothetical protein